MPSEPDPGTDLPAWLAGEWTVVRTINGDAGHFTGTARFTRQADGDIRWHEQGELTLGDYSGPAQRTLLIAPASEPHDGVEVRFDDGRHFHHLDLRGGHAEPEHLCGPDLYRGVFDVRGPDRFTVSWRVTGPRKDDLLESTYRRDTTDGG